MPQPQLKTDPKPKDKSPKLVKGNGKEESAAVKKAKDKKLEVQPKFDVMKTKENPAIQAKALELKKVQKARTQLSNEETRLNAELVELMKAAKFTVYEDDVVKIEPPKPTKEKFKVAVKAEDDEDDE